jgi:O-antigen/teichoic acid export membrane protein
MRGRARWLSGYAVVLAGTAGARAASFLAAVIIARELGPSGFGDFTLFFAVLIPFASATDFLDIGYVRHANVPGGLDKGELLRATLALKAAAVTGLVLLSYPIAFVLAEFVLRDAELAPTLTAGVLCGVLIGWISLRASTFLAESRYAVYGAINSSFFVAALVALVAYLATGSTLTTNAAYAIFLATSVVLALLCGASLLRAAWPLRPQRPALRRLLRFGKWLAVAQILYVAAQRLDIMLLSRYVPIEDVGQYGAALRITVIASLMIGSMASFLLPRATRTHGSFVVLRKYLVEGAYLSGGLCIGILVLWVAAPLIVTTFLGEEFEPAISLTRVLLLGVALLAVSTPMVQLLVSDERPRMVPLYFLAKYSVLAVTTVLLAPSFGATGTAWAFVISELVGLVLAGAIALNRWNQLAARHHAPIGA